jgi:hypothetical protein
MTVNRIKSRVEALDLGDVRLYREDLEDIATAIGELGPLEVVCDQTFTATGPEDFASLPENPRSLRFLASREGRALEVALAPASNRVTVTNPDTLCHGIASRVRDVCHRPGRHRPSLRLRRNVLLVLAAIGCIVNAGFVTLSLLGGVKLGLLTNAVSVTAAAPPIAGSIYMWRLNRTDHLRTYLINAYRRDRPSFWRRTKDDWAVETVVGAIFLVVGFVLGKISE